MHNELCRHCIDYAQLVHDGMDAFWIVDADSGVVIETNKAYCKMTGYDESDVVGKHASEFTAYDNMDTLKERIDNIRALRHLNFAATHRAKDGSLISIDSNIMLKNKDGKEYLVAFMRNETQKLKSDSERRIIQDLFMEFADNVDDVFWVRDLNSMLFVNQAYENIWGKSRQALYANLYSFMDVVIDDDRDTVQNAFISEPLSPTHVFDEIFRMQTADGEIRWIHAKSFPIYDRDGKYIRSTGIAKDITAQKTLSMQLHQMNTQLSQMVKLETQKRLDKELAFRSIFKIMGSSVCILDTNGIIIDANKQFVSLFGCENKKSIIGKHFSVVIHPSKHEIASKLFEKVLFECGYGEQECESDKRRPYEWRVLTTGGRKLKVLANIAYFNDYKKERNIIASMIDITAMRDLEKKQKESEKLLVSQSKMAAMGEMIGAIAHQWRQPLSILSLVIQDIAYKYQTNDISEEYVQKFSTEALEQIAQMSKTIDDFRNFFRSDKKLSSFGLAAHVKNSLSLVQAMLKSHSIDLVLNNESNPHVSGYKNELTQVILNIVNNAKEAFEARKKPLKSCIVITTKEIDRHGVITIKDNAGGIGQDIIDRIFEPYFTTKGPDKGTGIGLYMSKTIIETNMNGHLSVYNEDGGAVFIIKIPLAKN